MTFVSLYGLGFQLLLISLHVSSGVHRIYNRFSYWIFLFHIYTNRNQKTLFLIHKGTIEVHILFNKYLIYPFNSTS
jgi:hypothetical protein